MTKKRFTLKNWNDYAEGDYIYYDNGEEMGSLDVLDALNSLSEENEYYKSKCGSLEEGYLKLQRENKQLKSDNNRLVNETAKVVAKYQRRALDLIDDKIDELEKRYKFGQEVYKGCLMHNIRFGINVLKELKRELTE